MFLGYTNLYDKFWWYHNDLKFIIFINTNLKLLGKLYKVLDCNVLFVVDLISEVSSLQYQW